MIFNHTHAHVRDTGNSGRLAWLTNIGRVYVTACQLVITRLRIAVSAFREVGMHLKFMIFMCVCMYICVYTHVTRPEVSKKIFLLYEPASLVEVTWLERKLRK